MSNPLEQDVDEFELDETEADMAPYTCTQCLMCDQSIAGVTCALINSTAEYSKELYAKKLGDMISRNIILVVTQDSNICLRCRDAIDSIDRLENEYESVKKEFLKKIFSKYPKSMGGKIMPSHPGVPTGAKRRQNVNAARPYPQYGPGMKVYKCGFCSFQNRDLIAVRSHMSIHLKTSDRAGSSSNNRMPPSKSTNGTTTNTTTTTASSQRRVFRCQVCQQSFPSRQLCLNHISATHKIGGKKVCMVAGNEGGNAAETTPHSIEASKDASATESEDASTADGGESNSELSMQGEEQQQEGEGQMELQDGQMGMQEGQMEIQEGQMEMQEVQMEMQEGQVEMQEGQLELQEGQLEMQDGQLEMQDGQLEMQDGQLELQDGQHLELQEGQIEMQEGQLELQEGQMEMRVGQLELQEGQHLELQQQEIQMEIQEESKTVEEEKTEEVKGEGSGVEFNQFGGEGLGMQAEGGEPSFEGDVLHAEKVEGEEGLGMGVEDPKDMDFEAMIAQLNAEEENEGI